MEMTVRIAIDKMRKVGASVLYLRNGTSISIFEMNASKMDYIGGIKWNPDGTVRVLRKIFCRITPSSKTKGLEELKKNRNWYLFDEKADAAGEYQFFNLNEFVLPERIMNEFISDNGDIDTYRSISEPAYMLADVLAMQEEMDKAWED